MKLNFQILLILFIQCVYLKFALAEEETEISFVISARNLPEKDFRNVPKDADQQNRSETLNVNPRMTEKSDPYVEVFLTSGKEDDEENDEKIGKTDSLNNIDNPVWNNVFSIERKRLQEKILKFVVWDYDSYNGDDLIGSATISDFKKGGENFVFEDEITVELANGGNVTIRRPFTISFKLGARNIAEKDRIGGRESDPYVKCYFKNAGENEEEVKFHQTAVVNNVKDVDWKEKINFNNYDPDRMQTIIFKMRDSDVVGRDENLGDTSLDLNEFLQSKKPRILKMAENGTLIVTIINDVEESV